MAEQLRMPATESPGTSVLTAAEQPRGHCEWDGCRQLTGRQERFATDACRAAWWKRQHPYVTPSLERQGTILQLLLGLMSDGQPRTIQQISEAVHALPCSVSARIRQARKRGHVIVRDKLLGDSHGQHVYRLVIP